VNSDRPIAEVISVRAAEATDLLVLAALFEQIRSDADWLPPVAAGNRPVSFAEVTAGEQIHVAISPQGEVLGFVSVDTPNAFIHHLYVDPSWQGRGVATALLDSLERTLPRPWQLKCVVTNTRALGFYSARGWTVQGRGDGDEGPWYLLVF
jgi:GNAT superfamily N-acetyltransferase